ncbi:hypothetical protein EDD18DRAFT_1102057 [Armillaria luteobubalina]|uniref:Uncharacterized protein n=1 Tax=Armillaria luteobubalina TaxID=153913 RepID=A0AA39V0X8_9AGAR|nr:hypothetical protein EDD18DRAFT_1102057 [Armillaria luteobubalina]
MTLDLLHLLCYICHHATVIVALIRVPTNLPDLINVLTASGHVEIVPYNREESREGRKIRPKTKSRPCSRCFQVSLIGVILLAALLFYVGSYVAWTVEIACSGPLMAELEKTLSSIVEAPEFHSRPAKLSSSLFAAAIERGYEELLSASRTIGPGMPYMTSDGRRSSQMVLDSLGLSAVVGDLASNLTGEIISRSKAHSLDSLIHSAKSVGANLQTITQMSIQGAQLMAIEKETWIRAYDHSASSFLSRLGWNSAEQKSLEQLIDALDIVISRQGAASLLFSHTLSRLVSVREKMDGAAALNYDVTLLIEDQWFAILHALDD